MTQQALYTNQIAGFAFVTEGISQSLSACTGCSPNAMNVDLRFIREIEIEHVCDVLNIDAPDLRCRWQPKQTLPHF